MRRVVANNRQKDLPLVFNKVEYDGSNPIGMTEDRSSTYSSNLGTDRPLQGGKCIIGDGTSVYIEAPVGSYNFNNGFKLTLFVKEDGTLINNDIICGGLNDLGTQILQLKWGTGGFLSFVAITNNLATATLTSANSYNDGEWHKLTVEYINGTLFSFSIDSEVIVSGVTANLFDDTTTTALNLLRMVSRDYSTSSIYDVELLGVFKYKCDSLSTTTLYDSLGNNNHGTIVNYYAGFWGEQNKYSYLDEVGYTNLEYYNGSAYKFNNNSAALGYSIVGTIIPTNTGDDSYISSVGIDFAALRMLNGSWVLGRSTNSGVIVDAVNYVNLTFIKAQTSSTFSVTGTINGIYVDKTGIGDPSGGISYVGVRQQSLAFSKYFNGELFLTLTNLEGSSPPFNNVGVASGSLIPKDESITLPPFKDVLGNNLQYIGKAPSRGEFKESNAWAYSAGSYFSIVGLITTDTVEAYTGSAIPTIPVDGQLHIASGEIAYGVTIKRSGVEIGIYAFSEYINNPATFAAYNISIVTVNKLPNATLVNGSTANRGLQYVYHDLQRGVYFNGTQQVPLLSDGSAFADGTPLSSGLVNSGFGFLDTGTGIEATPTPRVSQAEKVIIKYTDANGDYITLAHADFTGAETGDQDFNDVSETDIVKDMRKHHKALTGRQLLTEKVITKN